MDAAAMAKMLERDETEWLALCTLLDSRPADTLHRPDNPDWNARDVYSHFARWINHSTDDLEANLAGRTLARPSGTDDEINARWQAEDSALELNEARAAAHRAFERRLAAIESIPPDRWTPALDAIALADGWEHIEAHRKYIESASKA